MNHGAFAHSPTLTVALWIFKYWAAWGSHSREVVLPAVLHAQSLDALPQRGGVLAQLPRDARVAGGCSSEGTRGAGNRVFLGLPFSLKRLRNFWSRGGNLGDFAVR